MRRGYNLLEYMRRPCSIAMENGPPYICGPSRYVGGKYSNVRRWQIVENIEVDDVGTARVRSPKASNPNILRLSAALNSTYEGGPWNITVNK